MTKNELNQLRKLIAEKKDLEERAKKRKFNPSEMLADTVKDYRTGTGKIIVIRGYGDKNWLKVKLKYTHNIGQVAKRIAEMEDFLDSIQDAEMRQILRMRYQDGLTQEEIADTLGYSRQAIQKKEKKFWETQK